MSTGLHSLRLGDDFVEADYLAVRNLFPGLGDGRLFPWCGRFVIRWGVVQGYACVGGTLIKEPQRLCGVVLGQRLSAFV